MSLATCCLGESRSDWGQAMEGEFQAALEDGRPLAFATGCLVAAWREMPRQEQGRFALANHAFALGLLIPMAVLQLKCVAGLPYLSLGQGWLYTMLPPDRVQDPYLAEAYRSAIPPLLALWLLLGVGHLRLAWVLMARDWARVVRIGSLTAAASLTLVVFTVVLLLDDPGVSAQAVLLAIELTAIYALARWHSRLLPSRSSALVS
jgi:hypothetical protein